jgi:hypothetical protein
MSKTRGMIKTGTRRSAMTIREVGKTQCSTVLSLPEVVTGVHASK